MSKDYDREEVKRLRTWSKDNMRVAYEKYKEFREFNGFDISFKNAKSIFDVKEFIVPAVTAWENLLNAFCLKNGISCIIGKDEDGYNKYRSLSVSLKDCSSPKNRDGSPFIDEEDGEELKELILIRNKFAHSGINRKDKKLISKLNRCIDKFDYYYTRFNYYIGKLFGRKHRLDNNLESAEQIPPFSLLYLKQSNFPVKNCASATANLNISINITDVVGSSQGNAKNIPTSTHRVLTLSPGLKEGLLNLPPVQEYAKSCWFNNGKISYAADVARKHCQEPRKESHPTPMDKGQEQLHRYILFSYRNSFQFGNKIFHQGNIGDNIQTIATRRAISQIYKKANERADGQTDKRVEFVTVQRDQLISYQNKPPAICVMQGWFEHGTLNFLPGKSVIPVWLGTHWTPYTRAQLSRFLGTPEDVAFRNVEVGCRDKATLEFCRAFGIPAYFSRCLTLTFPRRDAEPKSPKIFVVTTPKYLGRFRSFLPQSIKENATVIQQQSLPLGKEPGPYEGKAKELLTLYRNEAGLVITTALRCALPCIAMGIPTAFVRSPDLFDPDRLTGMEDIVPVWTFEDLRKKSFPSEAPNIEPLKDLMIENLDLSIRKAKGASVDEDHLREVRQKIENFSAL